MDLPKFDNDEERFIKLRENRIIFLQNEVNRLEKRKKKHNSYAEEVLESLI